MSDLRKPTKRLNRPEKAQVTYRALIKAAMRVVSQHGYANASVAKITAAAGLSQGTFYTYFNTRQDILSQLLPDEGIRLLRDLGSAAHGIHGYFEHERITFLAFFDFLKRNPYFLRVLTEAETAAPQSHAEHMVNIEDHYVNTLTRAHLEGEVRPQSEQQSRVLAEILAGARGHIAVGVSKRARQSKAKTFLSELDITPEDAAETYIKFIRSGLGEPGIGNTKSISVERKLPSAVTESDSRALILQSAARIIHERGYESTSVAEVAKTANVAIGTFYLHFRSRNGLIDEVLLYARNDMIRHVRSAVRGGGSFFEIEQRGFLAFFDYIAVNPWYIRVESEAAVWAPETYLSHFADLTARYVESMQKSKARGEFSTYDDRDFPVLAFIFMAARHYIATRYILYGKENQLPPFVSEVYFDLVGYGLRSSGRDQLGSD